MEKFTKSLNRVDYFLATLAFGVGLVIIMVVFFRSTIDGWIANPGVDFSFAEFIFFIIPSRIIMINLDYRRGLDIFGNRYHSSDVFSASLVFNILEIVLILYANIVLYILLFVYRMFLVFKKGSNRSQIY